MLVWGARMLCLASASASFLSPLSAQARQPGSVARSAVQMLPPGAPTAEEKARKSFVQTEMRSEWLHGRSHTRPAPPCCACTSCNASDTLADPLSSVPSFPCSAIPPPTPQSAPQSTSDLRPGAAMKLHTRDQAPKEGQQPAEKPVAKWEPGRAEYLQFLVDSRCRRPSRNPVRSAAPPFPRRRWRATACGVGVPLDRPEPLSPHRAGTCTSASRRS